jgi:putative ABC transport system permease protein
MILSRLVGIEREQIGLLKAFGYSSRSIGTHYLKLAVVAISGGIVLGIALGAWLGSGMTALYADFFHFPILEFHIPLMVYVWSFVISILAASVGAVLAVRKAVRTQPAEAMRPEPPADFRAGFMERLGIQKYFSAEVRMVVRNLSRHPFKALLSAFGISLSVALLFLGFYFYDAINRLIEIQFGMVQKEDIEVTFNEPMPARARFDLMNLPGVERVEPYRAVPVRLRFANHTRRAALMGLEAGGGLRAVVDKNLRVVPIPNEGIVLSKTIADSLGAKKGDTLTVEVTEGARPIRDIKIADVVEEALGLGVYMDSAALHRIMRESSTLSGAFLTVDEGAADKLYKTLKNTPAVAGVSRPQAALDSFNETMAQTIGTSTTFLIGFACMIAFGVVYNGARIALSERGRELASLRVLGYTQREIGVVLLGEQAIITAWAAPLGWLIGFLICLLITHVVDSEIIRLPLVVSARTFLFSFLIVAAAALISGVLVAWRLKNLDLIKVLKTRE